MKIGITGAAGFIGRAIAERARRAGHEVTGLDRAGGGFATHVGDINDLDLLHRFCRGLDRVYHTAALVQQHEQSEERVQRAYQRIVADDMPYLFLTQMTFPTYYSNRLGNPITTGMGRLLAKVWLRML